jgi:hypothetical protein
LLKSPRKPPGSDDKVPPDMAATQPFTLPRLHPWRLWAVPLVFAVVWGLPPAFDLSPEQGRAYLDVAGTALSLTIVLAPSRRDLLAAGVGFGVGTAVGLPVMTPCTGGPIFLVPAALLGWLSMAKVRKALGNGPAEILSHHPFDLDASDTARDFR